MKQRILIVSIILLLLCVNHTSAYALQLSGQSWNSNKYFQGDNGGTVTITLYNNVPLFQWYIKTVEIQFDWQVQSSYAYQTPVGQNIASGQSGTYSISFDVPSTVSVGNHSYTMYYVGAAGDMHSIATGSLFVHDMYEKQYDGLLSSIQYQLNSVPNYNSPDAKSDLSQAQSDFVQATTLASQSQFQSAVEKLNAAQSMISQANSAEQSYNSNSYNSNNYNSGGSNNNYYSNSGNSYSGFNPGLIIIFIIPAVAAVGGIVFWKMRKKNTITKPRKPKNDMQSSTIEKKTNDTIPVMSNPESKVEDPKNKVVVEESPKVEAKPTTVKSKPTKTREQKITKEKKPKKSKKEIEQDQKALDILKERLAKGTIAKSEYDELKKEFE